MAARAATAEDLPPEFADVDSDVAAYWLEIAAQSVSIAVHGQVASDRQAMLAAHYLALMGYGASGSAAVVTSRHVGDVSETYAVSSALASPFSSTKYGQIYLALRPVGGMFVA